MTSAISRDKQQSTTASQCCTFPKVVPLSVTMCGKTMDLTFNITQCCNNSFSFLVDSLPFREGRFDITLSVDQAFYPGTKWTKN